MLSRTVGYRPLCECDESMPVMRYEKKEVTQISSSKAIFLSAQCVITVSGNATLIFYFILLI